jgi:hypothetical protein
LVFFGSQFQIMLLYSCAATESLNLVKSSLLRCGPNKICALVVAVFVVKKQTIVRKLLGLLRRCWYSLLYFFSPILYFLICILSVATVLFCFYMLYVIATVTIISSLMQELQVEVGCRKALYAVNCFLSS